MLGVFHPSTCSWQWAYFKPSYNADSLFNLESTSFCLVFVTIPKSTITGGCYMKCRFPGIFSQTPGESLKIIKGSGARGFILLACTSLSFPRERQDMTSCTTCSITKLNQLKNHLTGVCPTLECEKFTSLIHHKLLFRFKTVKYNL